MSNLSQKEIVSLVSCLKSLKITNDTNIKIIKSSYPGSGYRFISYNCLHEKIYQNEKGEIKAFIKK